MSQVGAYQWIILAAPGETVDVAALKLPGKVPPTTETFSEPVAAFAALCVAWRVAASEQAAEKADAKQPALLVTDVAAWRQWPDIVAACDRYLARVEIWACVNDRVVPIRQAPAQQNQPEQLWQASLGDSGAVDAAAAVQTATTKTDPPQLRLAGTDADDSWNHADAEADRARPAGADGKPAAGETDAPGASEENDEAFEHASPVSREEMDMLLTPPRNEDLEFEAESPTDEPEPQRAGAADGIGDGEGRPGS